MAQRAALSLVLPLASLVACSRREFPPGEDLCDGAPCEDATMDLAPDSEPPRDTMDATTEDTAVDATPQDTTADAGQDVAQDLSPEAPTDTAAAPDASPAPDTAPPPDTRPPRDTSPPMDAAPPPDTTPPPDTRPPPDTAPPPDTRTPPDTAPPTGGCVSGVTGTHALRFRWTGSGSGSRATVSYELNTLPDRARWRVSAASRSIGYTPVFVDPFLAEGGLDLSGTVFIDVELSTAGLPAGTRATLAVYGRSFNTTTSGSFAWRTFAGTGAAPSGLVANSAPYRWYRADASAALVPGDASSLLRITPGPPSGSLVVARVELCFEAR
ncbi:MAG: hypothetical protein HY909_16110 [Deltaproteobacteria bacterium]|nr:hypothetical protein [Deltaproteobacteria bacterium]